jgi:PPOX class probable F420-dependent enzyme
MFVEADSLELAANMQSPFLGRKPSIFILKSEPRTGVKVIQALPGMPNTVTEAEVGKFLQSKLNIQLATIDEDGYPIIQPVWFHYDTDSGKIYTGTQKMTKKVENLKRNPDKVYFSIDDENFPYNGVKGKGVATISEDRDKNLKIVEKINLKYLGTLEHPLAKMLMENTKNGTEVVIEITPRFFSAWDFAKAT